jgi:hypothetical protein
LQRAWRSHHHRSTPFSQRVQQRHCDDARERPRGSGDIGAMLATAWGINQIDPASNQIFVSER